ncbi:methylmalonyl-CoA decarboxylase alpha subunit [Sporomusaceae bacterium BoRhaA]|uniref:methylmalonyl-CoA decarboxylase subunit alpha n=1 Tax=Pelorhabdus rhamnosifermentans TaxID=2772457 RepID=UPI001C06042F|nr:carboxyl transferase domain-containing protein [Pelorhabdus rhamnosifermentans]MBU2699765.1 methylmalonyl-CoA decarboxylase alpha subunit [Pelorhabdus rhamnosifermentans]
MATVQEKLQDLKERREKVIAGGGQKAIDKQHAKGKLTSRERIDLLLDPGSFVELDQFVTHRCTNFGMEKKESPGEGVTTGYGTVDGRLIYVYAQDFTVIGGALGEMHAAKIAKVQQMALKMGAPIVGLADSGGARIQEAVDALSGYGKIFFNNTMASGVIPQISVIMGPSAGGAVYSPALTDFIFMVKNTSQMFLTGPAVIKSVTAEEVTAEALGGAITHNQTSGVSQFAAENDEDALKQVRYLLSFLPSNNLEDAPIVDTGDDAARTDEGLNTLMPDNPNQPYDMYDVIKSIVDNGEYFDVASYFGKNMITCFARIDGQSVGIIANQPAVMAGCLDINASDKAARFVRTCDAYNIPLLTLVDVPGFLPGTQQEYGGVIRHGAKMLYAYSEATVPKITVITRKAYGGSYLAMCSKDLGADQVFAWPSAEIAVMGPAGAANIIFRGHDNIKEETAEYIKDFANPYKAAERGFVDIVIEPSQTRPQVVNALNMLATKRESRPAKKHGNIPL